MEITEITFNDLPQAVADLKIQLADIKELILKKNNETKEEADELLTVPQAAKFLTLSVPSIYGLISKGELPVMKRSKRCYFSKLELMEYVKQGRKQTLGETAQKADAY